MFGRVGRYPFRYCVPESDDPFDLVCNTFGKRAPVLSFTDGKTWYPGIEYRPDLDPESPLFFRDQDASTVVPSRDGEIYSTRVVDKNGRLVRDLFGLPLGGGHVLGRATPPTAGPRRSTAPTTARAPTCRWACSRASGRSRTATAAPW